MLDLIPFASIEELCVVGDPPQVRLGANRSEEMESPNFSSFPLPAPSFLALNPAALPGMPVRRPSLSPLTA